MANDETKTEAIEGKLRGLKKLYANHPVLVGAFWCVGAPSIIILGDLLIVCYFPSSLMIGAWLESFWINEQSVISPIVSLFAFFVATFGLFLAGRRTQELLNQNNIAERGQVIERFTRAIEQLGNDNQAVRVGGLYGLERIA